MKRNKLISMITVLLLAFTGTVLYIGAAIFFAISSPWLFAKVVGLMILASLLIESAKALLKVMDGE